MLITMNEERYLATRYIGVKPPPISEEFYEAAKRYGRGERGFELYWKEEN